MKNKNINLLILLLQLEQEDYWIFKIEDPRRNFLINNVIDKKNEYSIEYEVKTIQKREFYGKVLFLFFDELLKEWTFEYEGNVKDFEYTTGVQNEFENKKYFKITFNNINRLNESRLLDDLKYSIKCIKKLNRPSFEIKNNLNKISRIEYDAIVLGEIYYSRTVFYKLFDSLQEDHKLAFYNQIFNLSTNKFKIENNCSKLLELLQDYIKKNIYKSAQLFVESIEILKKTNQNIDLSKVGFNNVENKNNQVDYILPNYEYSKIFISAFDNMPSKDEVKNEYSDFNKTENEFYKIFKSVPFPLDLL